MQFQLKTQQLHHSAIVINYKEDMILTKTP